MSDFSLTWKLTRGRLDEALKPFNEQQLNWRIHEDTLTIGEMAVHVAGVEVWFVSQLTGEPLDEFGKKVARCATDGAVNDNPFPFTAEELTPETVQKAIDLARVKVEAVIEDPTQEILNKEIRSALGPIIDGRGAFARLGYHPGYHHGQVHMIKTAPGFPD